MADKARSSNPVVQAQLDRLTMLSPGRDVLGLERIAQLLARLDNPHLSLPPVFHVAGTNGKGSTCALLRAMLEAAGYRVHVYSSPHLVRFNERIRLAGRLIDDALLAALLSEVLDVAAGIEPSFFEVTTAAAFLAFGRTPADACIIEVGLGGRLDATNVLVDPLVTGVAQLGMDHEAFLGDSLPVIAGEKAGIAKLDRPLVTQDYPAALRHVVAETARQAGAVHCPRGGDWDARVEAGRLHYHDGAGVLDLPLPALAGEHQADNAALAIAMVRHQDRLRVSPEAMAQGLMAARWPARLQPLHAGPLRDLLPDGATLLLDGAHNPTAAQVVADHLRAMLLPGERVHLVAGLLANKELAGVLAPFADIAASLIAVPVPDHAHHAPDALAAQARALGMAADVAGDVAGALAMLAERIGDAARPLVLIMGSLYLAGVVLDANREWPD